MFWYVAVFFLCGKKKVRIATKHNDIPDDEPTFSL